MEWWGELADATGNGGTDVKSCPRREVLKGQGGSGLSPCLQDTEGRRGMDLLCPV